MRPALRMEQHRRAALALGAVHALVALTALHGGASLMRNPTGWAGLTVEHLAASPFRSYWVPGLVLFCVVGGSAAAASVALLARWRYAFVLGALASMFLFGWIAIEAIMMRTVQLLQLTYLALSMLGFGLAWRFGARQSRGR